jgi:3-hydroxyisobutyrate dehydrogenase-like beta-hydroxyacid dehydrogenase
MANVAFFGLGKMGEPMARNLLTKGHGVVAVPHRNREPLERLRPLGAKEAATPAEAAAQTDVAITIVPTIREVEALIYGEGGLAAGMGRGFTIVDMSTSFPPDTRRVASRVAADGGRFLDAPVTGGPKGAADGTLTIMAGGDAAVLEGVRPVLEAIGKLIYHFGDVGAGHTAKLVQNLIGIVSNVAIAEGMCLAAAAGLDLTMFFQMLSSSTANSPALQAMVPRLFARDFDNIHFKLELSAKDLRQATQLARELAVPMPASSNAVETMNLARAAGYGEQDSLALVRGLERVIGKEIRGEIPKKDA